MWCRLDMVSEATVLMCQQRMVYEMTTMNIDQVQFRSNDDRYREHTDTPKWSTGLNAKRKVYLTLTLTLVLCFDMGPFDWAPRKLSAKMLCYIFIEE